MSVPFKNVTITVKPLEQAKLSDKSLDNIAAQAAVATGIQGFLDQMTPEEAFMTYNVKLATPATLDLEISDASFYSMSTTTISEWQLQVTGSTGAGALIGTYWRIVGRPMIYDDGLAVDHAHFLVEQTTYPL